MADAGRNCGYCGCRCYGNLEQASSHKHATCKKTALQPACRDDSLVTNFLQNNGSTILATWVFLRNVHCYMTALYSRIGDRVDTHLRWSLSAATSLPQEMNQPDSRESSPDPLTLSWNSSLAIRPHSSSKTRSSLPSHQQSLRKIPPVQPSSPIRQQQTLVFSSPSGRSSYDPRSPCSPWRIRVTVQAERDENEHQKDLRMNTATTTTQVPLKGPDEHVPVTRRSKRKATSMLEPSDPVSPVRASSKKYKTRSMLGPSEESVSIEAAISPSRYGPSNRATQSSSKKIKTRKSTPRKQRSDSASSMENCEALEVEDEDRTSNADGDGDGDGNEDETSILDRSLAESEDFSMVSIDSLRSHREVAEKQAAIKELGVEGSVQDPTYTSHTSKQTPAMSGSRRFSMGNKNNATLFAAFGSDTKRVLSAGLALGERLAREDAELGGATQQPMKTKSTSHRISVKSTSKTTDARLPSPPDTASISSCRSSLEPKHSSEETSAKNVSHTETERPSRKPDDMSWKPTGLSPDIWTSDSANQQGAPEERTYQQRMDAIHRNAWAVASQITNAPTNVEPRTLRSTQSERGALDDSNETVDIWQEEADRSFDRPSDGPGSRLDHRETEFEDGHTPDLSDLFNADSRPSRAKLPRTWRRESGYGFLYGDEAESLDQNPPSASHIPVAMEVDPVVEEEEGSNDTSNNMVEDDLPEAKAALPRSILSSPERREQQQGNTPKEVRFVNRDNQTLSPLAAVIGNTDERYFSSEDSTELSEELKEDSSFLDNHSSPLAVKSSQSYNNRISNPFSEAKENARAQKGFLEQLKVDLLAMATPRGRALASTPPVPKGTTGQQQHVPCTQQLLQSPVTEDWSSPSEYTRYLCGRPKDNSIDVEKHVTLANSFRIQPPLSAPQQPLLYRLANWLYPKPPPENTYALTWNRNHNVTLHYLWKLFFEPPHYLNPRPWTSKMRCNLEEEIPADVRQYIDCIMTFQEGQCPLRLTLIHCFIAGQFMHEAHTKGIYIFCDGNYSNKPKRSAQENEENNSNNDGSDKENESADKPVKKEWPKYDRNGKFMRVRQEWTPEEVLKAVYAYWLGRISDYEGAEDDEDESVYLTE